jgi:hypothetical protein
MKLEVGNGGVSGRSHVVSASAKRAWVSPAITVLPRLTELTLQSIPCGGEPGGGGGTVCP